jgi:hypothetical protein
VWWAFGSVLATGLLHTMPDMGISPGGTTVRAATPTVSWCGWAWRIG